MIFQDRSNQEWKVTVDESTVYIDTSESMAVSTKLEIAAEDVAGYYAMSEEDKTVFKRELGKQIGVPMWPMFTKVIFEPELDYMERLGVFGRYDGDKVREEDRFDLFVPVPYSQAQQERPDLAPSQEELDAVSRERAMRREEFMKEVTCAVCVPKESLESEGQEKLGEVQESIQSCVVCFAPASAIGVYGAEEEGENLIFHGICRKCTPVDEQDKEKIQAIADAIARQEKERNVQELPGKE